MNLASLDDSIYKRSLEHVKVAIDFCSEIGAKLYTFHPGFLTDPHGSNTTIKNYDFKWDSSRLQEACLDQAMHRMIKAMRVIVDYAHKAHICVAFETEGSFHKKDHLLMQRPEEYEYLLDRFSPEELGINLNIGHLNLAAKAFGFSRASFVDQVTDYIVAMELSENDGIEDQHLPLQEDGWYWPLIVDSRFESAYKILEFRNTDIEQIKEVMELFEMKTNNG